MSNVNALPIPPSPFPRQLILSIYPPKTSQFPPPHVQARPRIYSQPIPVAGEVYHYFDDTKGERVLLARTEKHPSYDWDHQPSISWADVKIMIKEAERYGEAMREHGIVRKNDVFDNVIPALHHPQERDVPISRTVRDRAMSTRGASVTSGRIAARPPGITYEVAPDPAVLAVHNGSPSRSGRTYPHTTFTPSSSPYKRSRTTSNAPHVQGFKPDEFPSSANTLTEASLLFQPLVLPANVLQENKEKYRAYRQGHRHP